MLSENERLLENLRGGAQNPHFLKETMKPNWNFQRGRVGCPNP